MEMTVDERGRDEPRLRVDDGRAVDVERLADAHPASVLRRKIDETPVEQAGIADDELHACESTGLRAAEPREQLGRPAPRVARRDPQRPRDAARNVKRDAYRHTARLQQLPAAVACPAGDVQR